MIRARQAIIAQRYGQGPSPEEALEQAVTEITAAVREELFGQRKPGVPEPSPQNVEEVILRRVQSAVRELQLSRSVFLDETALTERVQAEILGLGRIDLYRKDPSVTEITINGTRSAWVFRRQGREEVPPFSAESLRRIVEQLLKESGQDCTTLHPIVDARLRQARMRINVVHHGVSPFGWGITLRIFPERLFTLDDLVANGTIPPLLAKWLDAMVQTRASILVAGGTGSGKTTTLYSLLQRIPKEDRILDIEAPCELWLPTEFTNYLVVETRPEAPEGGRAVSVRELVINALRQKPDRLIVGESRGGEVLDMLKAFATGHEGSMTTVHANDARHAVEVRLKGMVKEALPELADRDAVRLIAEGIDVVLFQRLMQVNGPGGTSSLPRVTEVKLIAGVEMSTGAIQMSDVFVWRGDRLRSLSVEYPPRLKEHFSRLGVQPPNLPMEAV